MTRNPSVSLTCCDVLLLAAAKASKSKALSSAVAKLASWAQVHMVPRGRDGEAGAELGLGELKDGGMVAGCDSVEAAVPVEKGFLGVLSLFASGVTGDSSGALSLIVMGS